MVKGRDTMVNENTREEVTAGDGLQLGHTSVDQSEMQTAEEEVRQLEQKVEQVSTQHTLTCDLLTSCVAIVRKSLYQRTHLRCY